METQVSLNMGMEWPFRRTLWVLSESQSWGCWVPKLGPQGDPLRTGPGVHGSPVSGKLCLWGDLLEVSQPHFPSPHAPSPLPKPSVLAPLPCCRAAQQRENLRELMFILVTPMSLSGVERLKEEASGESQKRSDSSSRSSSS